MIERKVCIHRYCEINIPGTTRQVNICRSKQNCIGINTKHETGLNCFQSLCIQTFLFVITVHEFIEHRFAEMSPRNQYCNYRYRDFCKRVLSLRYNYERYRYAMPRNGIFKYKCKCQNYRCTLDSSHIRVVITRSQLIQCRPITVCSIDIFTRIIQSTLTMIYIYIDSYKSYSITCTYCTHINEDSTAIHRSNVCYQIV